MNAEIAVDLIDARLLGADSIPVKIRTRAKVSEKEVAELFSAIDFIISYYSEKDIIPKRIALAFVDIYVNFNVSDDFYNESETQRYEDIGIALQEKAYELFK
ncbi:hypothetical protein [Pseudomonas amygdali]|uniref:hypothetical protein n=1 Tax=Pseudomonas amygdali TaxID=47877 RepID=UPI0006B88A76|nr:hypothetical protein [Pseudomonas amygdali]KWS47655.1 hypothetical protein AL057_03335 [Pseudomonas amygdali pv. myricae]RMT49589.1 hypothetical protein ALP46_200078 [Pseudomonas amygdali pv. myricae]RMU94896.1 hypothetical protein ALP18_200281 [Pseudomonas amygdali pv. myricae]